MSQPRVKRRRRVGSGGLPGITILALALTLGGCGGEDFAGVRVGVLSVTPSALTFNPHDIGVPDIQYLTLRNSGGGNLIVTELELVSQSDEFSVIGVELPLRIEPNQDRVIEVAYEPEDCRSDRGSLIVRSNDIETGDVTVPLQPGDLTGQVRVNPNPVNFGRVLSGDQQTIEVCVTNVGTCALTVNDLYLTGSFDFEFSQDCGEGCWEPYDPGMSDVPFTLETGESFCSDMTYHPTNDGYDEATMIVRSDDANNGEVDVDVYANGDQTCIVVTDEDGIDFGERFIGETHPKTITITNCSQRELLQVSSIDLTPHDELGGAERYALADLPDLSPALVIDAQESESFILNYMPILYTVADNPDICTSDPCEVADGAYLVIESNDEVKSPLAIEVQGVGTNNHCPVAVARARVQGSSDPWDTQVDAIPLWTLDFDGSGSSDPEGSIAAYQWEVTTRPNGSVATFAPSDTIADPSFFLDLAGHYVFSLRVFDERGLESCDTATVTAIVTPDEHIHVQLVWETPADPDRTDTGAGRGSDVDLHYMHPNGTWNRSPWDCHWANPNPNWGDTTTRDDDPSLDIDDTDGWGPENINHNNPEGLAVAPVTYLVGVYYFSDWGYGVSDATVRIYLDGIERFAATFPSLADRQFWDVARITWPTREITRIHRLYPSGFP